MTDHPTPHSEATSALADVARQATAQLRQSCAALEDDPAQARMVVKQASLLSKAVKSLAARLDVEPMDNRPPPSGGCSVDIFAVRELLDRVSLVAGGNAICSACGGVMIAAAPCTA